MEPPRDDLLGRTLGEFVVRDRIGEGGFGAVYRATQPLLGREAVVKVLQTRLRKNETAVQRFLREARLASRLDHPYAAHIYAFGIEKDGLLWIAMELVDGTPLDRLLRAQGRLPLDQAIPLIERLCEVIHTAHGKGIVHRDIKPSNVMVLSRSGQLLPKLLDLGIAKTVAAPIDLADTLHGTSRARGKPDTIQPDGKTAELASPETPADGATAQLDDANTPSQAQGRVLTMEGAVLGSPPYMAPEQWESSAAADDRTDLYALGILAFEVLAGRRPFEARTIGEMCLAHAEAPVPPLGNGFPEALDTVLAKALAKLPADRYASTLEFAVALKAAAGLTPETEPVPRLDPGVRDTWISGAPQPIAEAVAALEAARSVREARDAYRDLINALVHYVGVLALACHSRAGTASSPELGPALELIRDLRRRRFNDDDWGALARALANAGGPLLVPQLSDIATVDFEPARALAQAKSDRQIRDILAAAMAGLVELLGRLAFVLAYPIGVVRDDRIELWMGVRRPRRVSLPNELGLATGMPVLLDAGSRLVLELAPLVEIAQPTPGAPEELFMFDGRGNRGARLVALPIGFERNRDDVWDWFGNKLLDSLEVSSEIAAADGAPYPGLSAFTSDDAAQFFGREKEVEAFLNRLRVQSLLAVVGASGSGKSSFVQAGVIPNLPERWRAVTIRPGPTPMASLEAVLRKLDQPAADLAADLDAFGRALRVAGEAGTIVVVIDQFEELFTHGRDPAERLAFAESLARTVRSADDPVRVILTLRDDFLIAAEQLAPLRDRLAWGLQLLATPGRAELLRILTEPARRAGFAFGDPKLAEEMIDAVIDKPGSLALLAFTAAELWAQRDRKTKQLPRAAYEAMGGVGGALAKHADGVVESMVAEERRLVRETFRHVVTAEGTRAVINREDLRRILADPRTDAVLGKLIDARLLVTSEGPEAEDRIEIVHESLIEAWPRLRDWLREDAEGARLRDQLRAAAKQWADRGRPSGLLWRGDALAEYERWRKRYSGKLAELDDAFAGASLAEAARARRIRRISIAVAFVVLSAAVIILIYLRSVAERERVEAERLRAEAKQEAVEGLVEQGRQALLAGDSMRAAELLVKAHDEGVRTAAVDFMIANAVRPLKAQLKSFSFSAPIRSVLLSSDGTRIVATNVGDSHATVVDVATGNERRFDAETTALNAQLDPTAARLVTSGVRPRVWDVEMGRQLALAHDGTLVNKIGWTADGQRLVGRTGKSIIVWNATSGAKEREIPAGQPLRVETDRGRVVAASDDLGVVRIWDLATGNRRHELRGHTMYLKDMVFSVDGSKLASAGADGTARLWDVETGNSVVLRHRDAVQSVAFGPTGLVLTASADQTAKVWKISGAEPELVQTLEGHRSRLLGVFDTTGTRVVTAGSDGRACIHDVMTGVLVECLEGHTAPITAIQLGRNVIVTGSLDGTVRVWRADVRRFVSVPHTAAPYTLAIAPDSKAIVTIDENGTLARFDLQDDKIRWSVGAHASLAPLSLAPDGTALLTTDEDARIWDVATGARRATIQVVVGKQYLDGKLLRDDIVLATDAGIEIRSRRHPADIRRIDSADARFGLAISGDETRGAAETPTHALDVFDIASATRLHTLRGHTAPISEAVFGPNGWLATPSFDGSVRVWNRDGLLVFVLTARNAGVVWACRFDPGGRALYTAHEDGTVRKWSLELGTELAASRGHENSATTLALDPSNNFLASGGDDGTVVVWDLQRFVPISRFDGHTNQIDLVVFSPDGSRLVSLSRDRTVKVWHFDRGPLTNEISIARQRVQTRQ